jgi:hypothetical protein
MILDSQSESIHDIDEAGFLIVSIGPLSFRNLDEKAHRGK